MVTAAAIASGDFRQVMAATRSIHTGNWDSDLDLDRDFSALQGPQGATMSKAKYRLDVFLMMCRRQQWLEEGLQSRWVSLCF